MLLFRSEEHCRHWCKTWQLPLGGLMTLPQGWELAREWYHDRMNADWERKSVDQIEALFNKLGLTSPFWKLR